MGTSPTGNAWGSKREAENRRLLSPVFMIPSQSGRLLMDRVHFILRLMLPSDAVFSIQPYTIRISWMAHIS